MTRRLDPMGDQFGEPLLDVLLVVRGVRAQPLQVASPSSARARAAG